MKKAFLLGLILSLVNLSSFAITNGRAKKESFDDDAAPKRKHHRNGKKIATNIAGALATGIGKDAMENLKKKRNKDYSPVYPN